MQQQVDVLTEQFLRDFLKRWLAAWESADADRIASLCTDDVVMEDPTVPHTIHGRKAMADFLRALFQAFPKPRWEVMGEPYLSLDRRKGALHWRFRAVMHGRLYPPGFSPTGKELQFPGVDLYQFRDGRLSHYTALFDMLGIGREIGAAPKPGSFGERVGMLMQRMAAWRMRKRGQTR